MDFEQQLRWADKVKADVAKAQTGAGYGEELESIQTKLPSEEKGYEAILFV